jgi:hypothetical protein
MEYIISLSLRLQLSVSRNGRFSAAAVHVWFVVDRVALAQVSPEFFDFTMSYHSTMAFH